MDKTDWQFVNTFAPWLAALGTLMAVVVSLYLARRGERVQLKVSAGLWTMAGGDDHGKRFFLVDITNLGRRTATIIKLYWKPIPWRKSGVVQIAPTNKYSSQFPITLADGQRAMYMFPAVEYEADLSRHARILLPGFLRRSPIGFLRFCVETSTGHSFKATPRKDLWELVRKLAKVQGKKGSA